MPWFLWVILAGWVIGICYLIYNEIVYPHHTGLDGWVDYCCSAVIMMLWPVWGVVMLYYRFKPIKKVKDESLD